MRGSRWMLIGGFALAAAGATWWDVSAAAPASTPLPPWLQGEFAASAERYAGRTFVIDSTAIRFSRGDMPPDVVPVQRVEAIPDARSHVLVFDLHIDDAGRPSTIRLIASRLDSTVRLQTMPDVPWRRVADRAAILARAAQRTAPQPTSVAGDSTSSPPSAVSAGPVLRDSPAITDTILGERRFADQDPVAREELRALVDACRRSGCRLGIRGLSPRRQPAFRALLAELGATDITLESHRSLDGVQLTMLDIRPDTRR